MSRFEAQMTRVPFLAASTGRRQPPVHEPFMVLAHEFFRPSSSHTRTSLTTCSLSNVIPNTCLPRLPRVPFITFSRAHVLLFLTPLYSISIYSLSPYIILPYETQLRITLRPILDVPCVAIPPNMKTRATYSLLHYSREIASVDCLSRMPACPSAI